VSRVALERGAAAAREAQVEVRWVHAGLVDARLGDAFDPVCALYPGLLRTPQTHAERALLAAVAPGGTLLVVHHADVDTEQAQTHGFDPGDYVQPADVAAVLDGDWQVDVDEQRPRDVPAAPDRTTFRTSSCGRGVFVDALRAYHDLVAPRSVPRPVACPCGASGTSSLSPPQS
jgi:hypothetical protein